MRQPEALFKQRLIKCFALTFPRYAWCSYIKPVKAGTPDLVFSHYTFGTAWIEAKVDTNPLSMAQEFQIERMQGAGMRVRVLTAHVTSESGKLPWKHWSINSDFLDSRRGNRICAGDVMETETFWENLLT